LNPLGGVNPYGGDNIYGLQQAFAGNTATLQNRALQQQALTHAAQLAVVNNATGNVLGTDPHTWTPEEAAHQTDVALAKLSTVNPELAQKLADQRTGQDSGGGFFSALKSVAGEIIGGGLHAFGSVMDVISRTMSIVPNIAFDIADGGGFSLGDDLGGALNGTVRHNWNSVIQEMGWTGGGFGGILRAGLGLVGDIATDPITWVLPVGAGTKIGEAAAVAGKEVATRGLAERLIAEGPEALAARGGRFVEIAKYVDGMTAEELTKNLTGQYERLMGEFEAHGVRAGTASLEMQESAFAAVQAKWSAGELALQREMWEVGNKTAQMMVNRTFRTSLRNGIYLTDGKLIGARDVKAFLEDAIKKGARPSEWTDADKAAWSLSKTYASAAGGARLKFQIPFTGWRYMGSPLFNMSRVMPQAIGQTAMRFFAGQSGMANLVHLIATGEVSAERGYGAMRAWMEGATAADGHLIGGGWDRVQAEFGDVAAALGTRGKNLGSMFYAASDRIGGLTAQWDKGARSARAGLAFFYAHRAQVSAENAGRQLINESVRRAIGEDADHNIVAQYDSLFPEGDAVLQRNAAKYASYFPSGLDTPTDQGIEDWFRATRPDFIQQDALAQAGAGEAALGQEAADRLARQYRILADMKATAKQLTPEQKAHLDTRALWRDAVKAEAGKWEASIGNVRMQLDDAPGLPGIQAHDWRAGRGVNHPVVYENEGVYYLHTSTAQARNEVRNLGVSDTHLEYGPDSYGVHVSTKRTSPDDVEVLIRGKVGQELDATGNAKAMGGLEGGTAERDVLDVRQKAYEAIDSLYDEKLGALKDEILDPLDRERKVTQMMNEQFQQDTGSSFTWRREDDGSVTAYVFNPKDVKPVGDHFQYVSETEGYFHRTLTQDARKWVNGHVPKNEAQILLREPQIRAEIARKTQGMTFEESEAQARAIILSKFPHEDLTSLPQNILESHVGKADLEYIDSMATDIKAQILGKASDRMVRLGKIAPFMFTAPPRAQEFEWAVSKPWMKLLSKVDKKLASDILQNKKLEPLFLDAMHAAASRQSEGFGDFALLMDEAADGHIGLPDRELQVLRQHEGSRQRAYTFIQDAIDTISQRRAAIGGETATFEQARQEFLDGFKVPLSETDQSAIDAALADAQAAVKAKAGKVLPTTVEEQHLSPHLKTILRPDQSEQLGDGLYKYVSEPFQLTPESVPAPSKTYYFRTVSVDGEEKVVGYRVVGADNHVDTLVDSEFRRVGHGAAMIDAHWRDAGVFEGPVDVQLRKAQGLIEQQSFSAEGAALNEDALKRIAAKAEGGRATDAIWSREVAAGNLHYNKNTRSIFTREGNLVKRGGGTELRTEESRALERQSLTEQETELLKAKQALDEGTRYKAPPGAQAGQRLPGERRTAQERALYESQTSQARLELAGVSHRKATREAVAAGKTLGRLRTKLQDAMNELNKTYAQAKGIYADMQPAFIKVEQGNLAGMTALRVPGLEGYAMPALMAEEWHAALDKFGPNGLSAEWRKWVLGPWKRWATYRNPGFHVRNFYGAWFNNWLGGVTLQDYNWSWRVNGWGKKAWSDIPVSDGEWTRYNLEKMWHGGRGEVTYGDVQEHLSQIGVGTANTQSTLGSMDQIDAFKNAVETVRTDGNAGMKQLRAVDGKLRTFGGNIENYHRVAAWGRGMAATSGDTWGARSFVMLRHGDYAELTNAEEHIRDIIPFYKWMRTNIPYQIRMLGENPAGTLLVADKLKTCAYDVAGVDRQKAEIGQADWQRETMTIPIPSWVPFIGTKDPNNIKYAMFDLPYNDLYNGLQDYASAALPVVRNIFESYAFHGQTFTNKPLTGREVPLSGVFNLPGIRDLLALTGKARKGPDGNLYIDDRFENVLTAVPIYSRFRNFIESDPNRVENRLGGVFSFIAGVSLRTGDATAAELDFYYNEVEPLLQQYRDMGVVFPNAQDFVTAAEAVNPTLPSYELPQQIG